MLLYESRESSAIHSVRFSPNGSCLAVATQANELLWFEATEGITPRGKWASGIEVIDIAFSSKGEQLAVIGRVRKAGNDYLEGELTVLIAAPFCPAPSTRHELPLEIDGRDVAEHFTAPTFLPPPQRSYPLLVGTIDGVLGIDPRNGDARFRLATAPDFGFVTRRGLVYVPQTATLVVAFDMHPNLWLIA